MKPGDVIYTKSVRAEYRSCWVEYKARTGRRKKNEPSKVFMMLYLGACTLENPPDPEAALKALGWKAAEPESHNAKGVSTTTPSGEKEKSLDTT